ncbi:MAG: glycosyltransferase family 39 protein [Candidatus Omnitrophica bacterium]|nr:glycosyltransferase family 39 protein [Candidatus Omnitrophota bacterium]
MTSLNIIFIVCLFLGVLCCGTIAIFRILGPSGNITRHKGFWPALILCLAALLSRIEAPPQMHVDFYGYDTVAQNILYHGLPAATIKGSVLCPEVFSLPWRPLGYSLLLAMGYCVTGSTKVAPFLINILLGFLSVGLLYRIAWLFFRDNVVAACAAAILAFLPLHIKYSAVLTADVAGLFFFLMSVMFFGEWIYRRWEILAYAAIFSGCFSVYVKPEYGIIFLIGFCLFLKFNEKQGSLKTKQCHDVIYICSCLLLPLIIMVPRLIAGECLNARGAFFSLGHMKDHLWPNIIYIFGGDFGYISSGLFIFGITHILLKKRDNIGHWLLIWYLFGLLLISGYFAGSMNELSLGRHFFLIILPFILVAGWGWGCILRQFRNKTLFIAVCLAVLVMNGIKIAERWNGFRDRQAVLMGTDLMRQQWEFFHRVALKAPEDAYTICPSFPWQLLVSKTNKVIFSGLFSKGDMPDKIVYLKGIEYFGDQEETHKRILEFYRCKPLLKMPLTNSTSILEADFCERKKKGPGPSF